MSSPEQSRWKGWRSTRTSLRLRIGAWTILVFVIMVSIMTTTIPHTLGALVSLLLLITGTEWILRHRLDNPVRHISHQISHIRSGGGWMATVPEVDTELEGLARELSSLGPVLDQQVSEVVETERRAAVALTLIRMRTHTSDPLARVTRTSEDLLERNDLPPAVRSALTTIASDIEVLSEWLTPSEQLWSSCLQKELSSRIYET